MRQRFRSGLVILGLVSLLCSCNQASPEKYFDEAVLNVNLITAFWGQQMAYNLAHPTVKLIPGTKDQTTPMTRKEIIDNQIQSVEGNLNKIKALSDSEETRDMVQTSIKLHDYVLAAYKNEYLQLAKLYDDGASQNERSAKAQEIDLKYLAGYQSLFKHLVELGKGYAEKHHIKVNWEVGSW